MIEQTMKVKMTIVTALIQIIKQVKENHLSDTFWKNCETHLVLPTGKKSPEVVDLLEQTATEI